MTDLAGWARGAVRLLLSSLVAAALLVAAGRILAFAWHERQVRRRHP